MVCWIHFRILVFCLTGRSVELVCIRLAQEVASLAGRRTKASREPTSSKLLDTDNVFQHREREIIFDASSSPNQQPPSFLALLTGGQRPLMNTELGQRWPM